MKFGKQFENLILMKYDIYNENYNSLENNCGKTKCVYFLIYLSF